MGSDFRWYVANPDLSSFCGALSARVSSTPPPVVYTLFMARFFNTTGPCDPDRHYMLPPEKRLVRSRLSRYIDNKLYWVLHAPRQTGKTTFLLSWMHSINAGGKAVACYVSVESCQEFPRAEDAVPGICEAIRRYAAMYVGEGAVPDPPRGPVTMMLDEVLRSWAKLVAPKPLVVLFDEVDVLRDQAMVSFLRQLRGGFLTRGVGTFPVSVALVGMRDLRDYIIESKDGVPRNPGSPFNIKEDSASLSLFTADDVVDLVGQHTKETGQLFEETAVATVFEYTRGQPWLVNALCKKCVWDLCPNGEAVAREHVDTARELLIRERAVHLDSLAERLRDPRVKGVVESILVGRMDPTLTDGDDFLLATDLGLVTKEGGQPRIANPIYREVIVRVLNQGMQDAIPEPEFRWKRPDGTLDMDALLREFQSFWALHSDVWEQKADYTEAFPHLLLMAFLQRVLNGGGRIEREFAAGRGRVDVAVFYGGGWSIIEIKLITYLGRERTIADGLKQIAKYRDSIDRQAPAYLVVFDRTKAGRAKPWEERLTWEVVEEPAQVTIVGG